MKQWTPVEVRWKDAHGFDTGWMPASDLHHEPSLVTTVGLVYKYNDVGITVVLSHAVYRKEPMAGAYMFIPKGMIDKVTPLAPAQD